MSTLARRLRASALLALVVLAGCGSFQPFATPFVPRPALPDGDAFPNLVAEEAVARLEVLGFSCFFAPDSDIAGGWDCSRGDQGAAGSMSVSINADETGPIGGAHAQLGFEPGQSREVLDDVAAATFHEVMLSVFVPDDVQPDHNELVAMVAANWPTELGSGWLLGFDRSSRDRRMRIVYSQADAQDE